LVREKEGGSTGEGKGVRQKKEHWRWAWGKKSFFQDLRTRTSYPGSSEKKGRGKNVVFQCCGQKRGGRGEEHERKRKGKKEETRNGIEKRRLLSLKRERKEGRRKAQERRDLRGEKQGG